MSVSTRCILCGDDVSARDVDDAQRAADAHVSSAHADMSERDIRVARRMLSALLSGRGVLVRLRPDDQSS